MWICRWWVAHTHLYLLGTGKQKWVKKQHQMWNNSQRIAATWRVGMQLAVFFGFTSQTENQANNEMGPVQGRQAKNEKKKKKEIALNNQWSVGGFILLKWDTVGEWVIRQKMKPIGFFYLFIQFYHWREMSSPWFKRPDASTGGSWPKVRLQLQTPAT